MILYYLVSQLQSWYLNSHSYTPVEPGIIGGIVGGVILFVLLLVLTLLFGVIIRKQKYCKMPDTSSMHGELHSAHYSEYAIIAMLL